MNAICPCDQAEDFKARRGAKRHLPVGRIGLRWNQPLDNGYCRLDRHLGHARAIKLLAPRQVLFHLRVICLPASRLFHFG